MYLTSRKPRARSPFWLLFFGLGVVYIGLNAWLGSHGFVSQFDLHRWSKAMTALDASEFRIEHIGLLFPHGPIYLMALARGVLDFETIRVVGWMSALIIAFMFGLWYRHLWHKGYPVWIRLALIALLAFHPLSLWAASSGLHNALMLLLFYLFCYGCYLIISIHDLRAVMLAAALLAAMFFSDERTSFLVLALLPLIPFIAPSRMLGNSLPAIYIILVFPLLIAAGGWIYLNWVFHGNAWEFLQAPEASFRGSVSLSEHSPWLNELGGHWLKPVGIALTFAMIAFPLPLWMAWHYRRYQARLAASLTLYLHPLFAVGLATTAFFLTDVFNLLYLLIAATMAGILMMPRSRHIGLILTLLLLGNLGGWGMLSRSAPSEAEAWKQALSGTMLPPDEAMLQLGHWLRDNPQPTLLDDRGLYAAITERGQAHDLILPFTYAFKNEMKRLQPLSHQILVANPIVPAARLDRITQQFPDLYWNGLADYALVYDTENWRVWRKTQLYTP